MRLNIRFIPIIITFSFLLGDVSAQNIYELRKFSDEDWVKMTTDERLKALNVSNNHPGNQTFMGDFGRYYDLYPRWGYDYYEMEDRYENYAFRGFENYNIINDRRNKWYFNQFGDRLTKMTTNARIWSETYNDDGSFNASGPSGFMNSQLSGKLANIDGIWVAQESTDDWALSIVGAGAMRTKFTPLTLNIPTIPGMKADFQSENFEASIINSVYAGRGSLPGTGQGTFFHSLMLRGGQFRRKFGALTLGATYANMYLTQANREKGDTWKGTVHDYMPTPIIYALRIMDDSPQDGGGPIIHDVKLKVDGVYRPDIQPQIILDDYRRDLVTAVTDVGEKKYCDLPNIMPGLDPLIGGTPAPFTQTTINERMPKYVDYLYMDDYINGQSTFMVTRNFDLELGKEYYKYIDPHGKPFQVNGNEYVVYLYDLYSIKNNVKRVQAEVTVANDYRVQVAEIYTDEPEGGHSTMSENYKWYDATFWKTMAQADGNVKDGSNLRTVTVDFAWEVGNTIYGLDAHFNYLGFKIDGEYVTNTHHYMFSDDVPGTGYPPFLKADITPREGKHSSLKDNAYYFVAQKDWQHFGFTGEYFKMGKFYRPYMELYYPPIGSKRFKYNNYNTFLRVSMIEDNDDDDQYPDVMPYAEVMSASGVDITVMDPDGVFPGNDLDNDALPDNEKNNNGIPDYDEPFLMFDVDPDEYVFGDDFNNNNIPDFREDDMKYDTPYDLDRQGHHVNLRYTPQQNVNIMLGTLRTRGVGLETRTNDDYLKVIFNYDIFTVGNFYAEYRYHEIQDNVQDSFVVVPTTALIGAIVAGTQQTGSGGVRYARDFYYDEREYRNSKVNKFFIESRIRAIPSVTIENHVKYERNSQLEGTMYDNTFQSKNILTTFAMVNKIAYTKQSGNWTFSPGLKFRLYKKHYSESINPRDHYLMRIPVVSLKYQISPKTNITLGLQGFKGFELLYRDYIQSHNDYRQVNYVLEVANKTTYFGFDIWGGFGFKLEKRMFEEEYRSFEEFKSSMFFVQMWLGY